MRRVSRRELGSDRDLVYKLLELRTRKFGDLALA